MTAEGKDRTAAGRLVAIDLDQRLVRRTTAVIAHERAAAISDLLADNVFAPVGRGSRRLFRLHLSVADHRLVFDIHDDRDRPLFSHILSMTPLDRVVRDYYVVCEAYYGSVGQTSPAQFEAIDMGRRGVHEEGAELLRERLAGKIEMDQSTARCLFTLVASLYWRGATLHGSVHNPGNIR